MNEDQWYALAKSQQDAAYKEGLQAGFDAAKAKYVPVLMEHLRILADLRAGVEALRDIDPHYQPVRDAYDAVLALFDGSSDE